MSEEEHNILGRLIDEVRHSERKIGNVSEIVSRLDERSKSQEGWNSKLLTDLHSMNLQITEALRVLNQIPEIKQQVTELEEDVKKLNTFKDRTVPITTIAYTLISAGALAFFGLDNV